MKPPTPILAVMVHVADWKAGLEWYQQAFAEAIQNQVPSKDFGLLEYQGISIEIVPSDEKVTSGTAGSIIYWSVENFSESLRHFLSIGAQLYRGPIVIEHNMTMCQVLDPWGNCIGLRGNDGDQAPPTTS